MKAIGSGRLQTLKVLLNSPVRRHTDSVLVLHPWMRKQKLMQSGDSGFGTWRVSVQLQDKVTVTDAGGPGSSAQNCF